MRPLMLLFLSVPLLVGALTLVSSQMSVDELLLPPQAQWTWVDKLRAAGFSSDCHKTLRGSPTRVATDVLADGRIRLSCDFSGARHLPKVG